MKHKGDWVLAIKTPLGSEDYSLLIRDDMSGSISHPKGTVHFEHAVIKNDGFVQIIGETNVPMTTKYKIEILFSESTGIGVASIGDFVSAPITAKRA